MKPPENRSRACSRENQRQSAGGLTARLYHMTDDNGVRDLRSLLIARDTMHQNHWIAAAAELTPRVSSNLRCRHLPAEA